MFPVSSFTEEPEYISDLREKLRITKSKIQVGHMDGKAETAFKTCAKFLPNKTGEYTLIYGSCIWKPYIGNTYGTYISSNKLTIFVTDDESVKVITEKYESGSLTLIYESLKLKYVTKSQRFATTSDTVYTYIIEDNKIIGFDHTEKDLFQIKLRWKDKECNIQAPKQGKGYLVAVHNALKINELSIDALETINYADIKLDKPGLRLKYYNKVVTDEVFWRTLLFIKPKQDCGYLVKLPTPEHIYVRILEMNLLVADRPLIREIHILENTVNFEKEFGTNTTHTKCVIGEEISVRVTYDECWYTVYIFNKSKLERINVSTKCDNRISQYRMNIIGDTFTFTGDTPSDRHILVACGLDKLESEMSHFEYL